MCRDRDRVTRVRELAQDATEVVLGAVVEPARRLVEQHHRGRAGELDREHEREPLALREIARMGVVGDAGCEPVEQGARRARRRVRLCVRPGELFADRIKEQEVRRVVRHQPDQLTRPSRCERGGVLARDVDAPARARSRTLQGPEQRRLARAVAAHERRDLAAAQVDVHVADGHDRTVEHDDTACA